MSIKFLFLLAVLFALVNTGFAQNQDPPGILVFGDSAVSPGREVTLSGVILNSGSKKVIQGAIILLENSPYNIESDVNGYYTLTMPAGFYQMSISYFGYRQSKVRLHIYGDAEQDFALEEISVDLEEVTVKANRANENITNTMGGIEQLSIEKIQQQSKFLGETDVLRSLQSISGVSSNGEGASGFNVRGGNSDENLIFQDGNLILNPVHALGFFSLFHPDLVKNVTLYKGGVPAKYGGRLSSVLDVSLREGNAEKYSASGGVGVASSRIAIEGPLVKDKSSFIVGARASYFDWLLKRVNNVDLRKSEAFFYDLTVKADARLSSSTKVGFSAFSSHDDFQFADEVKFEYETSTASAYVKQLMGEKVNLTLQVNAGKYISNLFDINGNDQSRFDNEVAYQRGSLIAFFQMTSNYHLEVGVEHNRYEVSPGKLNPLNSLSLVKSDILAKERGFENALFVENKIAFGDKLDLLLGMRYTRYSNIGPDEVFLYEEGVVKSEATIAETLQFDKQEQIIDYAGLEPRISLRYLINPNNSIKFGYNRAFQFINQISNTASATPIDIWQLSNFHIQPQMADNYSIGYFRNFRQNSFRSQITAFYRQIDRLIEYKDFSELLLNQHLETELVIGTGKAYGLELTLNKDYGVHRLEFNYTYSRALRKIPLTATQEAVNAGKWYPSNHDKPNIVNLNYIFQVSDKTNLSVNFTYSTGRPTTAPISSYSNSNILTIPIYSDRNQFRIPDFHRADLAYTIGPWGKKVNRENSLTLSIYNVYARKNAFSVFFRQNPFQSVTAYRVAVLGSAFPAVTYNFKF